MRKTFSSYTDEELWRKFKMKCAEKGLKIADVFREFFQKFVSEG